VITLDLTGTASNVTISAFTIEGFNFGTLLVEGATNAAPSSWTFSESKSLTLSDNEDGRRKLYWTPGSAFTRRYLRLTPADEDLDASYFQIGTFACWPSITTMAKNFGRPYDKTFEDEAEELGSRVGAPSYIRTRYNLQGRTALSDTTGLSEYYALANLPRDRVIMLYQNETSAAKVYHCRRESSVRMTRHGDGQMTFTSIEFRQV
jgi:hypothetical protein